MLYFVVNFENIKMSIRKKYWDHCLGMFVFCNILKKFNIFTLFFMKINWRELNFELLKTKFNFPYAIFWKQVVSRYIILFRHWSDLSQRHRATYTYSTSNFLPSFLPCRKERGLPRKLLMVIPWRNHVVRQWTTIIEREREKERKKERKKERVRERERKKEREGR